MYNGYRYILCSVFCNKCRLLYEYNKLILYFKDILNEIEGHDKGHRLPHHDGICGYLLLPLARSGLIFAVVFPYKTH